MASRKDAIEPLRLKLQSADSARQLCCKPDCGILFDGQARQQFFSPVSPCTGEAAGAERQSVQSLPSAPMFVVQRAPMVL